jgi:hypothetical protein
MKEGPVGTALGKKQTPPVDLEKMSAGELMIAPKK